MRVAGNCTTHPQHAADTYTASALIAEMDDMNLQQYNRV